MKNKKIIAFVVGGVILVAIIAGVLIAYFNNNYVKYESAYKKVFKNGSVECKFNAQTNIDGKNFESTGDMKIKKNDKGQMLFLLNMTSDNIKLIEFTDGKYIYNDVNGEKTKIKIGEKSKVLQEDQGNNQKFDIDSYEQKLASFLEAGKIKDLKLLELVDSKYIKKIESKSISTGKQYSLTFAEELTSNLMQVFIDNQLSNNEEKVKMNVKGLKCTVNENEQGIVSNVKYVMSFDITLPAKLTGEASDKKLPVNISVKMNFVNPGNAVDFDIPSTDEYK